MWLFNVAGNNKTYTNLHVNCSILTKFGLSPQVFIDVPKVKSHSNSSWKSWGDACGQTAGKDMMKPTCAFCDYAEVPKNVYDEGYAIYSAFTNEWCSFKS